MTVLHLEIHPERSADFDLEGVLSACADVAQDRSLVRRFRHHDLTDKQYYMSVMFDTDSAEQLLSVVRRFI